MRSRPMLARRLLLAGAPALLLAACGFELRRAQVMAFNAIQLAGNDKSALLVELKRQLEATGQVRVVEPAQAQVILDVITDQRERVVVGSGTAGQVREFQLRVRFRFRLRTREGKELIPPSEILQQRDISYSESAALSKELEEQLLYRDMQSDVVQQTLRRLAAVKSL